MADMQSQRNASDAATSAASFYEMIPSTSSRSSFFAAAFVLYVMLCSLLRFRRLNSMRRQYKFHDRESLGRMTVDEAQQIMNKLVYLEFPTIYTAAMQVALLRTYSVANVARTLVSGSDLAKQMDCAKRYEDTVILYSCFVSFPLGSPEFIQSIARMNFLHAPYIKSKKILNKDLLYVLWASMHGPIIPISRYEWRPLADMEVAAIGTVWKHIGDLMGIDYAAELDRSEWSDGLDFMEHVTIWAAKYEDEYMKPQENVRILGNLMMDLLLSAYPKFVRPMAYKSSLVILGERMRYAFSLPEPSLGDTIQTLSIMAIRKFFLRYLALPRFTPIKAFSKPDPQTGRIQHYDYLKEPWYNPPTFWSRWSPVSLVTWAAGGLIPGDDPDRLKPEGFLFHDIGPPSRMGKGLEELNCAEEDLGRHSGKSVAPFLKAQKA